MPKPQETMKSIIADLLANKVGREIMDIQYEKLEEFASELLASLYRFISEHKERPRNYPTSSKQDFVGGYWKGYNQSNQEWLTFLQKICEVK